MEAKLASVPKPVRILAFARLDPIKGMEYAIRGAALAAEMTRHPLHLTVAGVPEEEVYVPVLEREVKTAREKLPVELVVLDHIFSPIERDPFLHDFDLYLFPTLREPFGITVVETGARGLPVVTTDSPGPQYLLGTAEHIEHDWGWLTDYGVLVQRTDDPERNLDANVAQGLVAALEDWQATARRALAFHRLIGERFTWENVVRSYADLYRSS